MAAVRVRAPRSDVMVRSRVVPIAALLGLNVAFRVPALLNANAVNSDAAVVGLQAMHMLRGEFDRFLWGAGYQGSFDAAVAALFFKVFGIGALQLMWSSLTGHLVLCVLAFLVLSKHVKTWPAFLLSLVLTFTPQAINGVILAPPRQWCVTAVFFAVWLVQSSNPARLFAGACVAWLSTFLDLYGLLLAVPLTVSLLFHALGEDDRRKRLIATLSGALTGFLIVTWLKAVPDVVNASPTGLSLKPARLAHNFPLLWEQCLPWVTGAKVWVPGEGLYPDLWEPPFIVRVLQGFGAVVFVVLVLTSPYWLRSPRVTWAAKSLGVFGTFGALAALGGFLASSRPADMWAARYLAPIVWLAPFALVPWAQALTSRGLTVLLAPYLVSAALGGWVAYGTKRGDAAEELKLGEELRARGVDVANAQYWLAYRLTFLWQEKPVVLSLDEDRRPEYRAETSAAKKVAYVFHPSEPRITPEQILPTLSGPVERIEFEGFTILLVTR
ncbi:MAG: hypothetical protein ACO1OB_34045 [Archangium sp.]